MSEMSDEELDYNRIENRLYTIKTLKKLRSKYKGKAYMIKKIDQVIKESEERIQAEYYLLKEENEELKKNINLVLQLQKENHERFANTGLNIWSLTTNQVLLERKILLGNEGDNQQSSK